MDAAKAEALLCPNVDGFYKALTQLLILHQPSSSSSLAGVDWKATNAGLNSLTLKVFTVIRLIAMKRTHGGKQDKQRRCP